MRWKSNKTKPVKNGLMDKIIYLDMTGQPFYNIELTGWGKSAKIDGKTWEEIKNNIWAWEYMDKFEQYFLAKKIDSLTKIRWGV